MNRHIKEILQFVITARKNSMLRLAVLRKKLRKISTTCLNSGAVTCDALTQNVSGGKDSDFKLHFVESLLKKGPEMTTQVLFRAP